MIVMKFGGTSNKDARAIKNVVGIIQAHLQENPVVVISAIAQATNMLERAAMNAAEGDADTALGFIETLFERHRQMLDELIHEPIRHDELAAFMKKSFTELSNLIQGVAIVRELTPRTLDAFYSYGELLSSKLVAATLRETGVGSQWIDTKDFMITDDHYSAARPMMEIVRQRLEPLIGDAVKKRLIPVTQGFLGVTSKGVRTTMGRESSDYSASIIGSALNVAEIQIWTDVDGVLTTDPGIVPTAMKVKRLSFNEAFDISYFGAKVLHPHTMLPAIERNIPVKILNSRKASSSGTIITARPHRKHNKVKSISFHKDIVLCSVTPQRRLGQYIFWEQIFNIFTKHNVPVQIVNTSDVKMILACEAKYVNDNLTGELSSIANLQISDGKGMVTLIGDGIGESAVTSSLIFQALKDIPLFCVSFGASPSSINLVIEENSIEESIRRLHDAFFAIDGPSDDFEMQEKG